MRVFCRYIRQYGADDLILMGIGTCTEHLPFRFI